MINALQQGNTFAFKQVYTQYGNKVFAYFKKKTGSEEDACDLMQTAFLKLWQYRASLNEEYNIEQHLFHIARTVFIDYMRKENKRIHLQKKMLAEPAADAGTNPSLSYGIASQLNAALSLMPDLRRKIFELNRLQGYSYKEVAELLSISVKSVDNHLSKALKQLRQQFILSLLLAACLYL